ncbi:asparaginase [Clostridium estertheticum]|uniref:asparaginase n=1 Tax=Clostridium estertheticum TaxID=238834 RepID=UPI001C7DB151|nr:asparaginase [Clostridium estertheticum]MBX4265051.1 asparaginase [Clostridium estertheticum]MBX4268559.1 asparaginase [Clostridium estertheticum]WLC81382.1 asparaginase [Clostridium estertheticum]WLC88515.1 asparaginase [Clostridium estertheticum]
MNINKKGVLTILFAIVSIVAIVALTTKVLHKPAYAIAPSYTISKPDKPNASLKNVVIIATGGTIAGSGAKGKSTNYKAGVYDVKTLAKSIDGLDKLANITGVQVCNLNSDDIKYDKWISIANTINKLAKDDSITGFVITHGTDTLDETAYFLNMVVKTDKPVVITGAMRPATAISADGPMNIYESVALAISPNAVGKGVMVAFSDGIYGARDVQKVSTSKTNAFGENDLGSLGFMRDGTPYFYNQSTKLNTTKTEFSVDSLTTLPKVGIAYFSVEADTGVLDYMAEHYDGIVVAGAGSGCMSEEWNKKLGALESKNFPIIRTSRIADGGIARDDEYDHYKNMILGGNLAPQKAKILLQLALTKTKNIDAIKTIFAKY